MELCGLSHFNQECWLENINMNEKQPSLGPAERRDIPHISLCTLVEESIRQEKTLYEIGQCISGLMTFAGSTCSHSWLVVMA